MRIAILTGILAFTLPLDAQQQARTLKEPHTGGSPNIHVAAHVPLGAGETVSDIEMEQELSRPYVYLGRFAFGRSGTPAVGVDVVDIGNPDAAKVIYRWRIENQELHLGGGLDNKYFKLRGRYYDVQSTQFRPGGPDGEVGAVVLDVTGLPDTSAVREVSRIHAPDTPGGFHNIFAYKHSDGRVLLFATTNGPHANVYDMERLLAGQADQALVGRVPVPEVPGARMRAYHDFYVGYDPATRQDEFYGAGLSGYFLFDVSDPAGPELITSITGTAGMSIAHTMTPTPDGRYVVTEMEYQYTPLRIFDLKPGLDRDVETISRPVGAWLASWDGNPHNHEVRWPYVFVSGYMDGLQVFNMMDPSNPYTVGYYYTCGCLLPEGAGGAGAVGGMDGAWGVDVRNADGMITISDLRTGFWAFKMDGFDGWNGHQWGMPNVSSAQDWDNGPDGVPGPTRVSALE